MILKILNNLNMKSELRIVFTIQNYVKSYFSKVHFFVGAVHSPTELLLEIIERDFLRHFRSKLEQNYFVKVNTR